jgi:hypothetical protein
VVTARWYNRGSRTAFEHRPMLDLLWPEVAQK